VFIEPVDVSNATNLSEALDVNVFKLDVAVCNVPITVLLLPVYVFNEDIEPVTPSIEVNLPSVLDVNVFKLAVEVSIAVSLPLVVPE
jgi:hypothetical protein